MTIHISTSKAHSGKDIKIIAYNDHNYKATHTFIHQVYGTENKYECSPATNTEGLQRHLTGTLYQCVAFALLHLARHIASPSPSEQIRAEVEAQATASKELNWNLITD